MTTITNTKYTLIYFDIRGIVETARLLLSLPALVIPETGEALLADGEERPAGSRLLMPQFEKKYYPIVVQEAGNLKSIQRQEYESDKNAGLFKVSMGKLPILRVTRPSGEEVQIPQSKAIERFLACEFGRMGTTSKEEAQIDCLCECVRDFKEAYQNVKSEHYDAEDDPIKAKQERLERWWEIEFPELLQKTEKLLVLIKPAIHFQQENEESVRGKSPWMVGHRMSLADIVWYQFLASPGAYFEHSLHAAVAYQGFVDGRSDDRLCPRIIGSMRAITKDPDVKEYFTKRDTAI